MPHPTPFIERLHRFGPVIVTGIVLLLLWTLVLGFSALQQRRLLAESERSLDLINRALTEQVAGLLGDAVTDLRVIDQWIQAHPSSDPVRDPALAQLTATLSSARANLLQLRLASPEGVVYDGWTSVGETPRGRLAIALAALPGTAEIAIADPQKNPADGRAVLPVVRRLGAPVGAVASAVALIDLDHLMSLHDGMRMQPVGAIALVRSDGVVLSRVPALAGLVGSNIAERAPRVLRMLEQAHGSFISDGQLTDGAHRLMTFRRVHDYPVTMVVAQGYDDALATYYWRRTAVVAVCTVITALALLAMAVLARAQLQARIRQAELAAVSDESPLGMFRAGLDGRLTYVNDAYLRIHGQAREEAAEGWLLLLPEPVRAKARADWTSLVRGRTPFHTTRRLHRADGTDVLVAIDTEPVVIDRKVAGHVGTVTDITEQARAEKALRTLTAIFDATTDFVVQTDAQGRMTYMNPAARRRSGIGLQDPIEHLRFADFNPPATIERHTREIVPAAVAHGVWIGETVQWDENHRELPNSHVLIAHRDKQGRVDYFSAIMRDISADKAAQQAVQRSEATLRSVADAMPAIVAVVDGNERYVFTNSGYQQWYGAARDAIVGRTVREVLGDAKYERSRPWLERVLAGEQVSFEKTYESSGRDRHMRITYIPLRLADGSSDGFISVAHDITEQRTEEERLREIARIDSLTGVQNRAGFEHAIGERARHRGNGLAALLYIDLDRFKEINDRHGHPVGDQVLKVFCKRLRHQLRPSDTLARLGGDEFAILLDGLKDAGNAEQVADKVLAAAHAPFHIESLELRIGASIGIALWRDDEEDWRSLVQRADAMLYRAKQAGRGRYRLATDL